MLIRRTTVAAARWALLGCAIATLAIATQAVATLASATLASAADPPAHTNRLAKETSPYLLAHAHNPVDWYPWGDEALAKAKAEKKPIFLSIGYASCHWCHVMERESFSDARIAAQLNANFVCIKVDREERPDIDEIYLRALQLYLQMAGSKAGGGWPMSMFLTPDAKPLMGGTYFPPDDRDGRLGFRTVLTRVQEAWAADSEKWQLTGDTLAAMVAESLSQRPIVKELKLGPPVLDGVLKALTGQYDPTHGGFGFDAANARQPKFPEPPNLAFLLEMSRAHQQADARRMLVTTLEKISQGGIRDHVGGGFHRYCVDRYWRVPHFEKMLYDNAQLVSIYAQAYELAPREDFRRAACETIEFLEREIASPGGGFYASVDADSQAADGTLEEGRFYVWTRAEVEAVLSAQERALWSSVYGLTSEPNFEGKYILLLTQSLSEVARQRGTTEQVLAAQLQPLREKLLAARDKRARPTVDTKIIASWNGLAIRGLADAGRVFKQQSYIDAAVKTADFVLSNQRDQQGRLLRTPLSPRGRGTARGDEREALVGEQGAGAEPGTTLKGDSALETALPAPPLGFVEDYAFVIDGLIALHQATGEQRWLDAADELQQKQLALFWDDKAGGFFLTSTDHEALFVRSKLPIDGAMPSGNSTSAANLIHLAKALGKPDYLDRAEKCIRSVSPILDEHPSAVPALAVAVSRLLAAPAEKSAPAKPIPTSP